MTVLILLAVVVGIIFWKSNSITKISDNKTYTFDTKQVGGGPPSYIKFIDNKRYVAIPQLRVDNDYNQNMVISFIQGEYEKKTM